MFRKIRWLALSILVLPSLAAAQVTPDDIRNMPVNSWLQVPGTNLSALDPCPTHDCVYTGVEGITGIHSYSGATLDTKRNRLVCWGGGHNAYYGNEVYAFDIDEMKWYRLTNPSTNINISGAGTDPYPDGQPSSRHMYNGQAYIAHADHLFSMSGVLAAEDGGCGTGGNNTWTFDCANNTWKNMQPPLPIPAPEMNDMAVYDPISKKVFWGESHIAGGTESMGLWSYDFDLNRWTHLNGEGYTPCIGIIDTKRNLLVIVGNPPWINVHAYHLDANGITSATPEKWTTTGGDSFIAASSDKGLQYDPVADKYVGIDGSGTIWVLDPETKAWTSQTPTGTKPYMAWLAGIYGLWQYVPGVNAYIFETYAKGDVSFYKFTAGGGSGLRKTPTAVPGMEITVQPNPFQTAITIRAPGSGPASVYDLKGRLVARLNPDKGAYQWRPSGMTPGIYVVKIRFNGTILSEKILLAR